LEDDGFVYFSAQDEGFRNSLWRIDATGNANKLTHDLDLPSYLTIPGSRIARVADRIFFPARSSDDPDDLGVELYAYDLATERALLVADINRENATNNSNHSSDPKEFVEFKGALYFTADDGKHGRELWRLAPGSTVPELLDLNPGAAASGVGTLVATSTNLYFVADAGTGKGLELWKINSSHSLQELPEINPGVSGAFPSNSNYLAEALAIGEVLYFPAADGSTGRELWKVGGDGVPTRVADINVNGSSNPQQLTEVGGALAGVLFFTADDGARGQEVWAVATDDVNPLPIVLEVLPGTRGSNPFDLVGVAGTLLFVADDGIFGTEIWTIDEEAFQLKAPRQIHTGNGERLIADGLVSSESVAYWFTYDNGLRLWSYRPANPTLPELVRTISPASHLLATGLSVIDDYLLFSVRDLVTSGYSLWNSDGTAAGTSLYFTSRNESSVAVNYRLFSSPPVITLDGVAYFAADNGVVGTELWQVFENSVPRLVADIYANAEGSFPSDFIELGDVLYFTAADAEVGRQLWSYDPRANAARRLTDINGMRGGIEGTLNPGVRSFGTRLLVFNDDIYFWAEVASGDFQLWYFDPATGTARRTAATKESPHPPLQMAVFDDSLYFPLVDSTAGADHVFRLNSDGTVEQLLASNSSFSTLPFPGFTQFGGALYFAAQDGLNGYELWRVRPNSNPEPVAPEINPIGNAVEQDGFYFPAMTIVGDKAFFPADNGVDGRELWEIGLNGVPRLVKNINPHAGKGSDPEILTFHENELYFTADDGQHGRELWKMTRTGSVLLVADLIQGPVGAFDHVSFSEFVGIPSGSAIFANSLYFVAQGDLGLQVYRIGAEGLPERVTGIAGYYEAGAIWISSLTALRNSILFFADDGVHGIEPWLLPYDGPLASTTVARPGVAITSGITVAPNALDLTLPTHFRITNIVGGQLFHSAGQIAVSSGDFVTVATAAAGFQFVPAPGFVGLGGFKAQAATDDTSSDLYGAASTSTIYVSNKYGWVESLYRQILDRNADADGLASWVLRLEKGASQASVAEAFWNSAERLGNAVDHFYRAFLGREADAGGRQFHLNQLLRGVAVDEVLANFVSSAEYRRLHPSADGLVDAMYRHLLLRESDASGKANWRQVLDSRGARAVALGLLGSRERHERVVDALYRRLLDRSPDPTGKNAYLARVEAAEDIGAVIGSLATSAEFVRASQAE